MEISKRTKKKKEKGSRAEIEGGKQKLHRKEKGGHNVAVALHLLLQHSSLLQSVS
jgi:hypothetical protein